MLVYTPLWVRFPLGLKVYIHSVKMFAEYPLRARHCSRPQGIPYGIKQTHLLLIYLFIFLDSKLVNIYLFVWWVFFIEV